MTFFLKVNVASALYGFVFFICIELLVNVYRISRITNWDVSIVSNIISVTYLVLGFILLPIGYTYLIKNWMERRLANLWTVILWLPYAALFTLVFAFFLPITDPQETVSPGTGLIIFGAILTYFMYLIIIHLISGITPGKKEKSVEG